MRGMILTVVDIILVMSYTKALASLKCEYLEVLYLACLLRSISEQVLSSLSGGIVPLANSQAPNLFHFRGQLFAAINNAPATDQRSTNLHMSETLVAKAIQ